MNDGTMADFYEAELSNSMKADNSNVVIRFNGNDDKNRATQTYLFKDGSQLEFGDYGSGREVIRPEKEMRIEPIMENGVAGLRITDNKESNELGDLELNPNLRTTSIYSNGQVKIETRDEELRNNFVMLDLEQTGQQLTEMGLDPENVELAVESIQNKVNFESPRPEMGLFEGLKNKAEDFVDTQKEKRKKKKLGRADF